MIRARAIDVLLRSGARLGRDRTGALIAIRIPAELQPLVDDLAVDLAWGVAGAQRLPITDDNGKTTTTGHVWRRCNNCGREQMLSTAGKHSCQLTPGCKGLMRKDHDPPPLGLLGKPVDCARPGCDRPACFLTHHHEPLCASDFDHLALTQEYAR